jgi:hypothetical protein
MFYDTHTLFYCGIVMRAGSAISGTFFNIVEKFGRRSWSGLCGGVSLLWDGVGVMSKGAVYVSWCIAFVALGNCPRALYGIMKVKLITLLTTNCACLKYFIAEHTKCLKLLIPFS